MAQKTLERRPSVDPSRNAKFALWGGGYCGVFQHFMYNVWYPRLFKLDSAVGRSRWLTVAVTTAFELGVHFPFIANPVYYACNALFTGSTVGRGLRRYREEFWDIMTTGTLPSPDPFCPCASVLLPLSAPAPELSRLLMIVWTPRRGPS